MTGLDELGCNGIGWFAGAVIVGCRSFVAQHDGLRHELVSRTGCDLLDRVAERGTVGTPALAQRRGSDLDGWMKQVREAGLIELDPFLRGLDQDHDAAVAGLTVPYSNGPIEGANTKTKLIKRQMYGRASFELLRHRILLA
ncbi:transposase [Nocardia sp. NPDC004085]